MQNFYRTTASRGLFVFTFIITYFSGGPGTPWFPSHDELTAMSTRTVILINGALVLFVLAVAGSIAWVVIASS